MVLHPAFVVKRRKGKSSARELSFGYFLSNEVKWKKSKKSKKSKKGDRK